jgi:hypothetical protein
MEKHGKPEENWILSLEIVKEKVEAALRKLRSQDSFLIQMDTNERAISHKLAEYLQEEFLDWNVDCEYNRHGCDVKKLKNVSVPNESIGWDEPEAKTIFPDIIVHRRNTDENNLLIIEVKKSSNTVSRKTDKDKIIVLTKDEYRYRFGLLLEISVNNAADTLEWYADGGVLNERKTPSQKD